MEKLKFAVKAAPVSQLQQIMMDFDLLIEFCKLSKEINDIDKQEYLDTCLELLPLFEHDESRKY